MIRYKHLGLILDSGINRNMKKIFLLFSLILAINAFTDNIVYEAGNVLESKKRTTPAVLYHYKNDLVRFKDDYGREQKSYEGRKFTKIKNSKLLKFKKPSINKKQTYIIDKTKISIEVHKSFKKLLKNKPGTIFGILGGSISDKQGRNVLTYGDIIRTNDLKTLSKVFKIKKNLSVVKVLRK